MNLIFSLVVLAYLLSLFRRIRARFGSELERLGDIIVIKPTVASSYGRSDSFSARKTYGMMVLTNRRIVFREPRSKDTELELSQIAGVTQKDWFQGSRRAGKKFIIIQDLDRVQWGFIVRDSERWIREVTARISQ